jgi:tyrosyl-tRNA synthetase
VIQLAAKYNVARMLERDDFKNRYRTGQSISVHEFLYPLMQAYDSVALKADVELGGTDQLFNLLVGRHIMQAYGLEPQCVMTTPILEGLDAKVEGGKLVGDKMSKSLGNYIGVTEPAKEIFGKVMSVSDDLMWRYYELLSTRPVAEITKLRADVASGAAHPKAAKVALAVEIAARYAGREEADAAAAEFERVFAKGALPDEIETAEISAEGETKVVQLPKAIAAAGLAASISEARRLIAQGGVEVDGARVTDVKHELTPGEFLIRAGKRRFKRVRVR